MHKCWAGEIVRHGVVKLREGRIKEEGRSVRSVRAYREGLVGERKPKPKEAMQAERSRKKQRT